MNGAWICTLKLARTLYPDIKYGNQYLRYALNLNVQLPADATLYPHRALYDVTAALLQRIIKDSGWTPEQMVQITEQPVLLKKFKFGKYRGQEIDRIAQEDPGYLRWMLKSSTIGFPGNTKYLIGWRAAGRLPLRARQQAEPYSSYP